MLELSDTQGTTALYTREERVRFLKSTATITDYGWGNGIAFAQHDVSPGRFVRRKLVDSKLRSHIKLDVRQHPGDELEFSVDRLIKNGFELPSDLWLEAEIYHRTRHISLEVRLPAGRGVLSARMVRVKASRGIPLHVRTGADGQQVITFEARDVEPGERLTLSWNW